MNLIKSIFNPDPSEADAGYMPYRTDIHSSDPEQQAEDTNTDQSGIKNDRKHDP